MLVDVLTRVTVVVAAMLVVATALLVGAERLRAPRTEWYRRLQAAAPVGTVLVAVLLVNRYARDRLFSLSRRYGVRATDAFYAVEGEFILVFQSIATTELTWYFSFVYVYGYAFLLLFPIVAYVALSNTRPLRELLTAYTLNYAIGITIYAFVLAFGPRNHVLGPEMETVLYDFGPQYGHLTREVNDYRNVFPSLHTSLATTVAIFASRTRAQYPAWTPIAIALAASVVVSTMYLGFHWAIDVVAGVVLAVVSVALAARLVGRWSITERVTAWRRAFVPSSK